VSAVAAGAEASIRAVELRVLEGRYAVCRLAPDDPVPAGLLEGRFGSVTRTGAELSIVCAESRAPRGPRRETGFRCLEVVGPLDFSLTGILSSLTSPLAAAGVAIFVLSTFDTDYVFVRESQLAAAIRALTGAGHRIRE
jgi:hypothetical protein